MTRLTRRDFLAIAAAAGAGRTLFAQAAKPAPLAAKLPPSSIRFENTAQRAGIGFVVNNGAHPKKYQAETMAGGGVALLNYNNDGLLDIYFSNGASLPELDKSDPKFHNRLYRNNGDGTFTDVTAQAGVQGAHYGMGVAAADYDNDGFQDLFVAGVGGYQLFHNNGNGTFTDVTEGRRSWHKSKLHDGCSVAAGWFDYNNDGLLDSSL